MRITVTLNDELAAAARKDQRSGRYQPGLKARVDATEIPRTKGLTNAGGTQTAHRIAQAFSPQSPSPCGPRPPAWAGMNRAVGPKGHGPRRHTPSDLPPDFTLTRPAQFTKPSPHFIRPRNDQTLPLDLQLRSHREPSIRSDRRVGAENAARLATPAPELLASGPYGRASDRPSSARRKNRPRVFEHPRIARSRGVIANLANRSLHASFPACHWPKFRKRSPPSGPRSNGNWRPSLPSSA